MIEHDALQQVLRSQQVRVRDLRTPAVSDLSVQGKTIPAFVVGTLRGRTGRVITLQCKLVGLQGHETYGVAGGTAALNESEWGMLGRSVQVPPPPAPHGGRPEPPDAFAVLDGAPETAPDARPKFPYPVRIMVGKKARGRISWQRPVRAAQQR